MSHKVDALNSSNSGSRRRTSRVTSHVSTILAHNWVISWVDKLLSKYKKYRSLTINEIFPIWTVKCCLFLERLNCWCIETHWIEDHSVVYFDQRTHACACDHMVENNDKCMKIIKKVLFSSYAGETHVRLTQEYEENAVF